MDLAPSMLPDPERPLRPREPRISAITRRGDGGDHAAGHRLDLHDARFGDLIQMRSIERRARVRRDVDRADHLAALGVEGDQPVAGGEPDALTIEGDAAHIGHVREWPVLANDLGR